VFAVAHCAEVARKLKVGVVADGGIKYSGDIPKAIAAGADAVMLGGLFAGTEESPGEVINLQGRVYKVYHGMGSLAAMSKGRSADRYFQENSPDAKKLVPEGIEPACLTGEASRTWSSKWWGLRRHGLLRTPNIAALKDHAKFVRITAAGQRESHPHDVVVTKEARTT
jgi:IMP dehydrogenase